MWALGKHRSFLKKKKNISFIFIMYFWLHWVFVAAHGLSLVAVCGGYSSMGCVGFSLWWLLLLWSNSSRAQGLNSWQCSGLAAPQHVGSSWPKE